MESALATPAAPAQPAAPAPTISATRAAANSGSFADFEKADHALRGHGHPAARRACQG
jgi:hypothetical protein